MWMCSSYCSACRLRRATRRVNRAPSPRAARAPPRGHPLRSDPVCASAPRSEPEPEDAAFAPAEDADPDELLFESAAPTAAAFPCPSAAADAAAFTFESAFPAAVASAVDVPLASLEDVAIAADEAAASAS